MQNADLVRLYRAVKAIRLPDVGDYPDAKAYREAIGKAMDDYHEAVRKFDTALLEVHHNPDSYLVSNLYRISDCYYLVKDGKVEFRTCIEITE